MSTMTEHHPPDMRIAKAFKFDMDDLIANRDGILSWKQRGLSDWIAYRALFSLRQLPIIGTWFQSSTSTKKQPRRVQTICGRIELEHHIVDRRLDRSVVFYEYYQLRFPGHDRFFRITREQHQVLTKNLKYRVYYQQLGEERHILSLERVIGSCDGDKQKSS